MKKSLLFLITATTLITGISCSDDNTGCNPTSDELGIPDRDGHDANGVEIWQSERLIFQDYYSLIQEEIEQKATIKSVWWLSPAKEECSVRWNCSAPIMGKTDHSSPYIVNLNYNMNSSQITVDLTNVTDSFTVEAIISIGDRCVRRFQTIPVIVREIRCDAFYYTFGTPPERLVDYIDNENALNTDILKATSYTGSPVDYLRFTDYPEQKLEKLYCTATASGAYPDPLYNLRYACEICRPPKEPEFELQPGTTDRYRVLNPQQWEVNGLRCTLENTTWRQLGASDDTDDMEFACLTIEKL